MPAQLEAAAGQAVVVSTEVASMVLRRVLAAFAMACAATFVAACAQTVSGSGQIAAGVITPGPNGSDSPSASGSDSPSDSPSESSSDSTSSTDSSPSSTPSAGANEVCQAVDLQNAGKAFGASATKENTDTGSCRVVASDGRSITVAKYEYLQLSDYKKGPYKSVTIGGNPAVVKTGDDILYLARSKNPNGSGLLAAYYSGQSNGEKVSTAILSQVLSRFRK